MKIKAIISSGVVGIIFGILSNYSILNASWFNLVIWVVVGILIGLFIENVKLIKPSGLSYGIFLSLSFLTLSFQGSSNRILGFALFSIFLSIIGAFCGWLLVFIGNWLKRKFK